MADAERRADVVWEGSLTKGGGRLSLASSGAATSLPVTWASRTARSEGKTSPEELIAAAHASCYSMALSGILDQGGHTPERLDVSATVTFSQVDGGYKVRSSHVEVRASIPDMEAEEFLAAAQAAKEGCPVSVALHGNVEITLEAALA